jgi:hypothetical protein
MTLLLFSRLPEEGLSAEVQCAVLVMLGRLAIGNAYAHCLEFSCADGLFTLTIDEEDMVMDHSVVVD